MPASSPSCRRDRRSARVSSNTAASAMPTAVSPASTPMRRTSMPSRCRQSSADAGDGRHTMDLGTPHGRTTTGVVGTGPVVRGRSIVTPTGRWPATRGALRDQSGPLQQPDGAGLGRVDHDGVLRLAPDDEGDDAVGTPSVRRWAQSAQSTVNAPPGAGACGSWCGRSVRATPGPRAGPQVPSGGTYRGRRCSCRCHWPRCRLLESGIRSLCPPRSVHPGCDTGATGPVGAAPPGSRSGAIRRYRTKGPGRIGTRIPGTRTYARAPGPHPGTRSGD